MWLWLIRASSTSGGQELPPQDQGPPSFISLWAQMISVAPGQPRHRQDIPGGLKSLLIS